MLISLKIKNYVLIEHISVKFSETFTVITGETGAGKSLIINTIAMVLGGKANKDLIRHGAKESEVEAVFDIRKNTLVKSVLAEQSIEHDGELIIRRIFSEKGQNKILLNDSSVTLAFLSKITPHLVDICSQFENQSLFSNNYQLGLIDRSAKLDDEVLEFKKVFKEIQEINSQLKELATLEGEREKKGEYLRYQYDEISNIEVNPEEDTELNKELEDMDQVKGVIELANFADEIFYGESTSILSQLEKLKAKAQKLRVGDFKQQEETIRNILSLAESLVSDLGQLKKGSKFNQKRRDEIYSRLESLNKIKRKYGGSIDSVLKKFEELSKEIIVLDNIEDTKTELLKKKSKLMKIAVDQGTSLNKKRVTASYEISAQITAELQDLNMKGSQIKVEILHDINEINSTGFDSVKINFAPNKGEPFGLLEKIASGGELSRITLAIHKVLTDFIHKTYIFDEVDSGIGGDTGLKVGNKLKEISKKNQVICITHLAQVAVYGDKHCLLEKEDNNNRVVTSLEEIDSKEERVQEIARMLSGDKNSKESLAHAEVMLKKVN
jgi:DNA repair protein RecN (Recombination protein N)